MVWKCDFNKYKIWTILNPIFSSNTEYFENTDHTRNSLLDVWKLDQTLLVYDMLSQLLFHLKRI